MKELHMEIFLNLAMLIAGILFSFILLGIWIKWKIKKGEINKIMEFFDIKKNFIEKGKENNGKN